jgi:hypothetical protein
MPRPAIREPRSGGRLWVVILLALVGVGGWLVYSGRLALPGASAGDDSVAVAPAPRPAARPAPAPAAGQEPAPAAGAPILAETVPPILVGGLAVDTIFALPDVADGFRVLHRDSARAVVELVVRPAADTLGEPAAGEVLLDVLPGDTGSATTMFEGYIVTLRGMQDPAVLGELLQRLFLVPRN